jgi:uncharacterized membrane protein (UPF0136 family)
MSDRNQSGESPVQQFVIALVIEVLIIGAGVIGWFVSGNIIWLIGGIILGIGFSGPAIIKFIRAKERN